MEEPINRLSGPKIFMTNEAVLPAASGRIAAGALQRAGGCECIREPRSVPPA